MARLWSDDLVVTNPLNKFVNKHQVLEMVESGFLVITSYDRQLEYIRTNGDTVIVAGSETVVWGGKMPNAGKTEHLRFTGIWLKQGGRWQEVARHANIVPQQPETIVGRGTADPISYFELAGPDAAGLARFYEQAFGWKATPGPFPNYLSLTAEAGAGIAGGFRQEEKPERVFYIKVADLDAAVAKVVAAGGRVLIPPTNVPGVVHFALFEDPQGNRTGLVK
jgi:hypothetical protein